MGDELAITVPGGIHNLSGVRNEKNASAPRVLQDVQGDFTATVKVTASFNPPPQTNGNAFHGAGILVFDSTNDFLRLERNIWTHPNGDQGSYEPLFEHWQDYKFLSHQSGRRGSSFFKGNSTYLRLERRGPLFMAFVSHDGVQWDEANSTETEMPPTVKVGVLVNNTAAAPLKVTFSEWRIVKNR